MFKSDSMVRLPVALLAGVLLTAATSLLLHGGVYGLTLFAVLPIALGALAVWCFRPRTAGGAAALGALAVVAATACFFLIGTEGAICIAMTLPLAAPLGALGGILAHRPEVTRIGQRGAMMLLLLPAGTVGWDLTAMPPVFQVRSAIEIAAPPGVVWKHVVTFAELPEPREWFFRAGLAYPIRARIDGAGATATRYCEFSTGPFVEPITVWDEPRLLRFHVTQNPAPMREWSPYAKVLPKHLHGYLVSKQGQFRLIPIGDSHTLLEGTTWYQHGLWPAGYWRFWSDAIIHRIHMRVLRHIQTLSES